jgi:GrpB-like predicted nucleotidyltransferase (UPF0157 family)
VLRVGVVPAGGLAEAVAERLREHGVDARSDLTEPVALVIAVVARGGRAGEVAADVVLAAEDRRAAVHAAGELLRTRLAPWMHALASGRPDVTAPPLLADHDPDWAVTAERRVRALQQALAGLEQAEALGLRRIDHIGSTAVPDLAAKPFLDLQVTLDRLPSPDALASALAPLGWAPAVGARPDSPGVHRDRRGPDDAAADTAFAKRLLVAPDPVRPAIVHVRLTASPFARRVVRFRDRLRADPELRRHYELMKHAAAAAHAGDQDYDDYTRDKGRWLDGAYRDVEVRVGDDPWPLHP